MQLLFATQNQHKLIEVRQILAGSDIEVVDLSSYPELGELPETHDTFQENALQKASALHAHTGLPAIADDSGLEVDALDGAPGVHSKRYSVAETAEANNQKLLSALSGVTQRSARFRCSLALVTQDFSGVVDGTCEGSIANALCGVAGFGYDPVFFPDGVLGKSMAEISMAEKNAISHRGRAFSNLPELLFRAGLISR